MWDLYEDLIGFFGTRLARVIELDFCPGELIGGCEPRPESHSRSVKLAKPAYEHEYMHLNNLSSSSTSDIIHSGPAVSFPTFELNTIEPHRSVFQLEVFGSSKVFVALCRHAECKLELFS